VQELWLIDWSVEGPRQGSGAFASHYLAVTAPIELAQYKEWMKLLNLHMS
jgi:hypothetical protein